MPSLSFQCRVNLANVIQKKKQFGTCLQRAYGQAAELWWRSSVIGQAQLLDQHSYTQGLRKSAAAQGVAYHIYIDARIFQSNFKENIDEIHDRYTCQYMRVKVPEVYVETVKGSFDFDSFFLDSLHWIDLILSHGFRDLET